jgi:hypothetical protein
VFLLFRRDPLGVLVPTGHPLAEPASDYPWSVLWRAADDSGHVRAVVSCAQAMSKRLGWLTTAAIGLGPAGKSPS